MKQVYDKTASEFWKSQEAYPSYPHTKSRRLYELNYLVPKLRSANTLLDLGCGTGDLVIALHALTDIKKYYAYDVSHKLSNNLRKRNFIDTIVKTADILTVKQFPITDVTIMGALSQYIFEDEQMITMLRKLNSPLVYLRTPCSIEKNSAAINSYSKALKGQYSSYYRTVEQMINILQNDYEITAIDRIWPDEIESQFGTKQYYFECRRIK